MARARSQVLPRLLTRADLRAYLGDRPWVEVQKQMKTGYLPNPVWGLQPDEPTARWDSNAVDRALDDASSVPMSEEQSVALLNAALGLR